MHRRISLSFSHPSGVYINGPARRIDVVLMRPDHKRNATSTDDWLAVRHFRLGDPHASALFDDTWRFVTLQLLDERTHYEGRAYVDGHIELSSAGYVQCLPWLAPAVRTMRDKLADAHDRRISVQLDGGALLVGYRYRGGVDELRVYDTAIEHRTIAAIGGEGFVGEVAVSGTAIVAVGAVAAALLVGGVVVHVGRRLWAASRARGSRDDDDAQQATRHV